MKRTGLIVARQKLGLTQQQVADSLGVSRSTYSRYEIGLRTPPLAIAFRLAEVLKTDPRLLFGDVAERKLAPSREEASA